MNVRGCWAAAVVFLTVWTGAAASQEKPFVWKAGKLQAQFPGVPSANNTVLQYQRDDGKIAYLAVFTVIPQLAKTKKSLHPAIFDSGRDNMLKELKGKLLTEREVKVGDHVGREFQIEYASGVYRAQLFLVGDRYYQLIVRAPKAVATGTEADRFFQSLRFIE
jgi:hypothetical protein